VDLSLPFFGVVSGDKVNKKSVGITTNTNKNGRLNSKLMVENF